MTMLTLNLKTITSAIAALAVTAMISWTFVDATKLARLEWNSHAVGVVSALVR
jgi:hypothetical protein